LASPRRSRGLAAHETTPSRAWLTARQYRFVSLALEECGRVMGMGGVPCE
jgi:hypothetical protein